MCRTTGSSPIPEDKVNDLLYSATPGSWIKKMMEQGYNYLDAAVIVQTMAYFFEFGFANLEEKHKGQESKKERKASKKHKSFQFEEDSDEDSSEDQKLRKKYCTYHGVCSHTTDAFTTHKELIKKNKQTQAKYSDKKKGKN